MSPSNTDYFFSEYFSLLHIFFIFSCPGNIHCTILITLIGVFTGSNKEFFGGVFRRVKEHQKLPSLVSYAQDAGEADDMDMDTVSGKMVGISNMEEKGKRYQYPH